ncbi:PREDICTED: uncharacterized protein LOC109171097 [Ipomoea nil]|uniref:uncharacterized protein LOC109171097 n=1 Tax=Ipomoea nil TaxID=35883 RepID=UPI000900B6D8|nr:PREDICTED: uncharacterized protein LOC109171097 [Ipomoea nil]
MENDANAEIKRVSTVGYPFTWERGRGTRDWVEERLDRVVVEEGWCETYAQARIFNVSTDNSDHSGLFLDIHSSLAAPRGRPPFHFENSWLLDRGCREVVDSSWAGFKGEGRDGEALNLVKELDARLVRLLEQENAFWKQRAKQHWLREADANTRYYHKYASARRRKNKIVKLKDPEGRRVEGEVMCSMVLEYYNNIFKSNGNVIEEALDFVQPRVTQDQNYKLMRVTF